MIRQLSGQIVGTGLLCAIFLWNCRAGLEPIQTETDAPARVATAAAAVVTTGVCNYTFNEASVSGWTKKFEENFDTSPTLASSQWTAWQSGAFNNELQLYTTDPKNVSVASGMLKIQAVKEAATGNTHPWDATQKSFAFTSARLESKTMFTPTRTEGQVRMIARIRLPSGYGMWPAFWSYGDNWPTNGEIDILEARGNEPFVYHNNYFYGRRTNVNLVQNAVTDITSSTSLTDCWHVYELIWTKDTLTFLFDGQVVDTKTGGYIPNLFGKLQRITLNVAVGGDYFGQPSASQIPLNTGEGTMQVDWVRVYTKK